MIKLTNNAPQFMLALRTQSHKASAILKISSRYIKIIQTIPIRTNKVSSIITKKNIRNGNNIKRIIILSNCKHNIISKIAHIQRIRTCATAYIPSIQHEANPPFLHFIISTIRSLPRTQLSNHRNNETSHRYIIHQQNYKTKTLTNVTDTNEESSTTATATQNPLSYITIKQSTKKKRTRRSGEPRTDSM